MSEERKQNLLTAIDRLKTFISKDAPDPIVGFATKSEIIQTAFKCAITSAEHRCREHFTYKGCRVFGPHYDIDELVKVCQFGKSN